MAKSPFYRGQVRRGTTDEIGQSSIAVVHAQDALDEVMAMLDAIIAEQPDGRHYVSSYAKTVVASLGMRMGVYVPAASADDGLDGIADVDQPSGRPQTKAAKGSQADAAARVKRLQSRGQAVPRELQLLADGLAATPEIARQMARNERAATAAPKPTKASRKAAATATA